MSFRVCDMQTVVELTQALEADVSGGEPGEGLYHGHGAGAVLAVQVDLVQGDQAPRLEDVEAGHVGHTVCRGQDIHWVYGHS